jgi:hypothetical protein
VIGVSDPKVPVCVFKGIPFAEPPITPEQVLDAWDSIANMDGAKEFKNAMEAGMPAMAKIGK